MQDVLQDPSSALPVEKLYTMKTLDETKKNYKNNSVFIWVRATLQAKLIYIDSSLF